VSRTELGLSSTCSSKLSYLPFLRGTLYDLIEVDVSVTVVMYLVYFGEVFATRRPGLSILLSVVRLYSKLLHQRSGLQLESGGGAYSLAYDSVHEMENQLVIT